MKGFNKDIIRYVSQECPEMSEIWGHVPERHVGSVYILITCKRCTFCMALCREGWWYVTHVMHKPCGTDGFVSLSDWKDGQIIPISARSVP